MESAISVFICLHLLLVLLVKLMCFHEKFIADRHRIHYLSASECKPSTQPFGSPSAHLSVQPHVLSGTGSSSSLSPASVAEDVFFNSTNEDQVKLYIPNLDHLYFFFPFLAMLPTYASVGSSTMNLD